MPEHSNKDNKLSRASVKAGIRYFLHVKDVLFTSVGAEVSVGDRGWLDLTLIRQVLSAAIRLFFINIGHGLFLARPSAIVRRFCCASARHASAVIL